MEMIEKIWNQLMINDPITTGLTLMLWFVVIIGINKLINKMIAKRNIKLSPIQRRAKKSVLALLALCVILFQFKASKDIVTTLLASTGIIAVIVGLACQEVASNLLAGAFIFLNKPYTVGEMIYIQSENIKGTVTDITFRQTVVKTLNNTLLIVPNKTMNTSIIENLTRTQSYCLTPLTFTIGYQDDIEKASAIIRQQILANPLHLKEKEDDIRVVVSNWLDSGIELKAFVYTANNGDGIELSFALRKSVKLAFDQAGITIPYTTITIEK